MSFILTLLFCITINPGPKLVKNQYFTFNFKEKFYIVQEDSVYVTLDGRTFNSWPHEVIFSHFNFNPLNTDEEVFLVSDGGGVVYSFKDKSLERIDDSFEHRNKYHSYDFILNNKIYSFGGYGLFDDNNLITKFDLEFKEWSENITMSKKPPKQRNSIGQLVDSVLYVGGGDSKHINKDLKLSKKNQNDFWQHDFGKKRWNYLGRANRIFLDLSNNEYHIKNLVKFGKNTLLITQTGVFEIDIKSNKLIQYNEFNENMLFDLDQIIYNPTTKLFLLTKLNYESDSLDLLFVNRDKLLGKNTASFKLYKNSFLYYFIVFILVTSIALMLIFRSKKNMIDIINNNLSVIKNELSSQDFFILATLLKHHPDPVQFPYLLSEYEPHLSYESRVKKLRLSMSNIDEVILKYTKKRALMFTKNKNDKRIKQVSLSK
tara:strand:+ start:851 stop:2140 length:1290 start_codon:yes stop_codon:yes gene_type:complete